MPCKFIDRSNWIPPDDKLDAATHTLINEIIKNTNTFIKKHNPSKQTSIRLRTISNLSKGESNGIRELKNNKQIIIKPSDKGGGIVIMNRVNYIIEAESQLNDTKYYNRIEKPIYEENRKSIDNIVLKMKKEGFLNNKQYKYLTGPDSVDNRTFYVLPKIHKPQASWPQPGKMPAGRPIISDVNSETYRISEYIDSKINPLACRHTSYVKNTYDFIDKLKKINIDEDVLLVTGDVTSLYTNMNLDRTIDCVKKAFLDYPDASRPDRYIVDLLTVALKFNDFNFNSKYFLQTTGTAMGKRFSPALANLYLLEFDNAAMKGFSVKPRCFYRYLDDIFFLWPASQAHMLKQYEAFLNSIITDIKITLNHNSAQINFLDVTVFIKNRTIGTKTYFKETDTHQLLHKTSHHPPHTFKGLIKAQLIRYKRLSTHKSDYLHTCNILFHHLKRRGYTYAELRRDKMKIWFNYKEKEKQQTNTSQLMPIIIDFTPISGQLAKLYRNTLTNQTAIKDIKPIIAYKNHTNLRNLLVRSRLEDTRQGYFQTCASKRCKTCPTHAHDCTKITSTKTRETFIIHDKLTCSSTNIIYLITCRNCKLQYVGETGRSLRDRLTQHKSNILNKTDSNISKHFSSTNHSFLDIHITAIEQTSSDTAERRAREKYWQAKLKTVYPLGLNGLP